VPTEPITSNQLPIRCFLSYAKADDEEYEFVLPLAKTLEHLCFSDSGRRLEVFVDREAIGWGENWRDKIADSLNNAMIFIPIISLQYFDRPACRTELQAFHAAAKQLGITELLLPLVVFGRRHITSESNDALVRTVEELQHLDIEDAVLSGPHSREWRTTMLDVARKLISAVEHAEQVIQDHDSTRSVGVSSNGHGPDDTGDREMGLYELDARMTATIANLEQPAEAIVKNLNAIGEILQPHTQKMRGASPEVVRGVAADVATDIEETALDIQREGANMETVISAVDADLRRYYALVMEFGTDEMKTAIQKEISALGAQFSEFRQIQEVMSDFIVQLQPVEVLSAPLRRSLRPLRTGVNSIQVTLSTMESWTQLGS
jgi:hypothetical protein